MKVIFYLKIWFSSLSCLQGKVVYQLFDICLLVLELDDELLENTCEQNFISGSFGHTHVNIHAKVGYSGQIVHPMRLLV